jgi:tRNA A-37 threonylcarbamoyl transferase component Bud32
LSTGESSRRFQFLKLIASGGFGSVFLAKVIHADGFSRLVAVKLLHPKWSENEEIVGRMRDEARLLGWLRNRNIVDVLDLTMINGRCAVIMEYLEAVDLKQVISGALQSREPIPARAALEAVAEVAAALDAAYNRPPYAGEKPLRVIHRDIKPSNVMVDESGHIKVLDFGTARADFDSRESKTRDFSFGSIEYMAPERLFFEPETPASDVYSLGATLYEVLALERLGKSKLRPDQHADFLVERFRVVQRLHERRLGRDLLDEVLILLNDMLAFDQRDRPTAGDLSPRVRALARSMRNEMGLYEYAEIAIRPLIQAWVTQTDSNQDPMVGQVVAEDSRALKSVEARQAVQANPRMGTHVSPEELGDDDEQVDDTMNQRWAALKSATLADIEAQQRPLAQVVGQAQATRAPSEEAGPRRRSRLGCWVAGALVAGVLFLGGGVVALVVALLVLQRGPSVAPPGDEDGPVTVARPPAPPEPEEAEAPSGPHATFTSADGGTQKMSVRCGGAEGAGVSTVHVEGAALGECQVVALLEGRKRLVAVVRDTEAREYRCFEGGAKECR